MKVAYISGPYRAPTPMKVMENIHHASLVALKYWRLGYAVICPHRNAALFDGEAPDEVWLRGDLELLRRSDVVVMLPDWQKSEGAKMECDLAWKLGKDIVYD